MVKKDWERIYKTKGEIQKEVLFNVKKAAIVFKKRKYSKILDLACGTGRHTIYLASKGFSVYGTDISRNGIEITKRKAKRYGLKNIKLKVHDMKKIPFPDNFFDGIVCVWSMGHGTLKAHEKIIREIRRVLRTGGMLVTDFMTTKNKYYGKGREIEKNTFIGEVENEEDVPHHYFTKAEVKKLFSKFSKLRINPAKYSFIDGSGKKGVINALGVEAEK